MNASSLLLAVVPTVSDLAYDDDEAAVLEAHDGVFWSREFDAFEFFEDVMSDASEPPKPLSRLSNIWTIDGGSFLTARDDVTTWPCWACASVGESSCVGLDGVVDTVPIDELTVSTGLWCDAERRCCSYFDRRLLTPPPTFVVDDDVLVSPSSPPAKDDEVLRWDDGSSSLSCLFRASEGFLPDFSAFDLDGVGDIVWSLAFSISN